MGGIFSPEIQGATILCRQLDEERQRRLEVEREREAQRKQEILVSAARPTRTRL